MKYLKTPGDLMTWNMEQHKNTGTSGEDYIWSGTKMTTTTKMNKPCSDLKYIGYLKCDDGTYKEFYQGSCNGYKFSMYTCHCKNFVTTGDDYPGSTGLHIHQLYFHGHQSIDYMQTNRNTKGVKQSEVDAKCVPKSSQYYINLEPKAGNVGCYESPGGKKLGDIKPQNYGGLTYTNISNKTHDTENTYKMALIKTDTYGECWVTCEHYEGRSRSTSKKYAVTN